MKKVALVSLGIFTLLFLIITFSKRSSDPSATVDTGGHNTSQEKENIVRFWEHYRAATDYRINEEWQQALESYRLALELNEEHEDALYYLGNMYMTLSHDAEAGACWDKLVQLNPQNSRAYLQLASLYLSSEVIFDIDKAEQACLQSLKINKEETGPLLLLGEVRLIRGRLNEAAEDFQRVTASNFKSTEAYFLGGYISWKSGDLTTARDLFTQAVTHARPLKRTAETVLGEGDTKKAKGFGSVASKSLFRNLMEDLAQIDDDEIDKALDVSYKRTDKLLAEVRRNIP